MHKAAYSKHDNIQKATKLNEEIITVHWCRTLTELEETNPLSKAAAKRLKKISRPMLWL